MFNSERNKLLMEIETSKRTKVILFAVRDRLGPNVQLATDTASCFRKILKGLELKNPRKSRERIALVLHADDCDMTAVRQLVNQIRQKCKDLEVIIPSMAKGAATLFALGADYVTMTEQAQLGPIIPHLHLPEESGIPDNHSFETISDSVIAFEGLLDYAKDDLGITDSRELCGISIEIAKSLDPLAIGKILHMRKSVKNLLKARRRKYRQKESVEVEKRKRIVNFFCSESIVRGNSVIRSEVEGIGLPMRILRDRDRVTLEKILQNFGNLTSPDTPNELCRKAKLGKSVEFEQCVGVIDALNQTPFMLMERGRISRSGTASVENQFTRKTESLDWVEGKDVE